jgi:hypothetical protein
MFFAAGGSRADQEQLSDHRGLLERDLLSDHPAQGETQHVYLGEAERLQERQCVPGHTGDGVGDLAGRAAYPRALEQDDLTTLGDGIGHCRIPVVQGAGEVLQQHQRRRRARSEAAVGVGLQPSHNELGWCGDVARIGLRGGTILYSYGLKHKLLRVSSSL